MECIPIIFQGAGPQASLCRGARTKALSPSRVEVQAAENEWLTDRAFALFISPLRDIC